MAGSITGADAQLCRRQHAMLAATRSNSMFISLTKPQGDELCRMAGVPPAKRDRFTRGIEECVTSYFRSRRRKSPAAVEGEIKQLEKRVRSCLRLLDQKKWRPGEYCKKLKAVSGALTMLSKEAHEYLEFRNAKVVYSIPTEWSAVVTSNVVIDPICFQCLHDQGLALQDLLGAVAGPIANAKGRGRPSTDCERALYHLLAATFTKDTGKSASDKSTKFMDVCAEIKSIFKLDHWRPESLPRSARRLRAQEKKQLS
jgi:hypothetical protein